MLVALAKARIIAVKYVSLFNYVFYNKYTTIYIFCEKYTYIQHNDVYG